VEGESTLHLIKFFQEYLLLESISTRYLGGAGVGPGQEGYAIDFREKKIISRIDTHAWPWPLPNLMVVVEASPRSD